MRKPFLLSLLVALLTTLSTHAYDFQSGDLYYNITSNTTVEITYQEQYSSDNYQGLTTATIPETVTYNGTTYSVTSIGDYAFYECSSLTSITIPNSVTSIGSSAFVWCSSLTSIVVESGNTMYDSRENCNAIIETATNTLIAGCQSTIIPNSVTSIGDWAFSGCSSLTSFTIPNSVTSIGRYAFDNVPNIVYNGTATGSPWGARSVNGYVDGYFVYADDTKTHLLACSAAATGEITLPNSVTSIGDLAFYYCFSLTSITIPNSVTSIGDGAFADCSSLTSITIPNSVTSIGDLAFYYCFSLTSITLPNSLTSIGSSAFAWCSAITSITIPNSVTTIGYSAFRGCSSLTSITLPNSVTSIGEWAFLGCTSLPVEDNLRYADTYLVEAVDKSLSTYTIKAGTKWIGSDAFRGCSSLTSITLPNSVTYIGGFAFYGCSSLTSITIPKSVTAIEDYTFYNCSSLTSITLPNSVTSIRDYAFYGCSSLTSITIPDSVTSIGEYAFKGCTSLPVEDNLRYADTYLVEAVDKSLSTYTIKAGTKWIGWYAFYDCSSLTSIILPNSVTSIGYGAFSWCTSLTSITLPNSVTSIENEAFYGCSSLTSITIGNSVTSIGWGAFWECSSLTSVTSLSCTPPSCESNLFDGTPSEKTLVVPSISMDAYKNSSTWKEFTSFESIVYPSITLHSSDSTLGIAQIDQDVDCDSVAIISAVGNPGYAFTQWSDGNTDNPRTIKLTQDTTFVAEFGLAYSGKCGDDLYWAYSNQEIKITGTGVMYNYTDSTMPWTLLRDSIKTVRIGNNATSIGEYAFSNTPKLAELHIGTNVEDIGENAFAGCRRLYDIYCYATNPPFAETNSFANYNVYVHVPCASLDAYDMDVVFGSFKYVECIGAEDTVITDKTVTVVPGDADATFTWPVTDNADTYSLVITKDGVTFCTLVFNAQGQLVSIAFKPRRQNAPAAEGTTPATYAEMTANGFRFTITGLDEGTAYAYTLTVRNAANTVLETYTGDFTTLSSTPTGINESAGEDAHAAGQVEKIIRDGQVLIIRNGETYDLMGQRL